MMKRHPRALVSEKWAASKPSRTATATVDSRHEMLATTGPQRPSKIMKQPLKMTVQKTGIESSAMLSQCDTCAHSLPDTTTKSIANTVSQLCGHSKRSQPVM